LIDAGHAIERGLLGFGTELAAPAHAAVRLAVFFAVLDLLLDLAGHDRRD
jgi:hypothetical protein